MKDYKHIEIHKNTATLREVDGDRANRVFSISKYSKLKGDSFEIWEECDGYFFAEKSKEDMIELLEELLDFVKTN